MLDKMTVRMEMLHETGSSPGKEREVYAWPSMNILRGKIQVDDGLFLGDLKDAIPVPQDLGRDSQERAALIRREHTR